MKILKRETSNTMARTDLWTVQPDSIDHPMLLIVTRPDLPAGSKVKPHGIIVNDGNNAAGTAAQLSYYFALEGHIPPQLTVAVGYTLDHPVHFIVQRNQQLTPSPWPEWDESYGKLQGRVCPPSGLAAGHLAFLTEAVQPTMVAEYGVDPAEWTLAGHSLGGLFSLYAMLNRPSAFRRYFGVGSSFWWRHGEMFALAEAFVRGDEPVDLSAYFAAGDAETADAFAKSWAGLMESSADWRHYVNDVLGGMLDIVADSERMMALIGKRPGCRTTAPVFANESHSSAFFVALSQGLRWLYEKP